MPILIIVFFALALLSGTLLPGENEIIFGGDLLTQFYYWKGFLAENLRQGIIPFWNPYNFSGTPFLAHPAVAAFYPFTLLFVLMPLNFAFPVFYLFHLIIGGLGIYHLCRLYNPRLSSLIPALVFMSGGYVSSRIYAGHVDLLSTAVWIPWVIYSLKSVAVNQNRSGFLRAVLALTMLILSGYNAYLVFITVFAGLYAGYLVLLKTPRLKKIFVAFAFIWLLSLGISAIQWLPTWQLTRHSIRGAGLPYGLSSWGSLPLSGLRLFIDPLNRMELNKIVFNLGGGPVANPFDHYPGRLTVIIIAGFITAYLITRIVGPKKIKVKLHPDFLFFSFVCLFFLLVSLGPNITPSLHKFLYTLIPFYRYIRIPVQNLVLPVVLLPVLLSFIFSKIKNKAVVIIAGIILVGDVFLFSRPYIFLTTLPGVKFDRELLNSLKTGFGADRILPAMRVISPYLDRFDLNSSMQYRFFSTSGYDPVILKNYYDFIDSQSGNMVNSLSYYNVEIPPIDLSNDTVSLLNVSKILYEDGRLAENKAFRERFYFSEDDKCPDADKKVTIDEYSLNKIILSVSNRCGSRLMSSEVDYPGWKAKVNGINTPIITSNIAFRTIYLPEGENTVEYYYSPDIYLYGMIISLISLSGSVIIIRRFIDS